MPLIIFDLDGTLTDNRHRLPLIQGVDEPDWDAYTAACVDDTPRWDTCEIYTTLSQHCPADLLIAILTGRLETARQDTLNWFRYHQLPLPAYLLMRPEGDYRPSTALKQDLLLQLPNIEIIAAFDDRIGDVEMFRSEGITTYHSPLGET